MMDINDNLELISYVFFGLLISLYAGLVFNRPLYEYSRKNESGDITVDGYSSQAEPSLPRYMTEKSRYNFYLVVYAIISVVLYSLLALLTDERLVSFLGLSNHPAGRYFFAAVIIIAVTPLDAKKLSWVNIFLIDNIREWVHRYAKIPNRGRHIFNVLSDGNIDYQNEICKRYIDELTKNDIASNGAERQDLDLHDFTVGNRDTISWKWARLSFCLHFIEEGNNKDAFTGQINESSLGWVSIKKEYQKAIFRVRKNKNNLLSENEQIELNEHLKGLLASTYRLISCLLLMVSRPDEDPVRRLKAIGFDVVLEHRYYVPSKEIIRVIASVICGIFAFSVTASIFISVYFESFESINFSEIFVFIASSFAILIIPIIIVLALKKYLCPSGSWGIAKPGEHYDRPVLIYVFSAALSWLISYFIMLLLGEFLIAQKYEYIMAESLYPDMALYSLLSALTALFVAYRVDIPQRIFKSKYDHIFWRTRGGVIQGMATAALTWICLMIAMYDGNFYPPDPIDVNYMGRLIVYEVLAFSTGFIIYVSLFFSKHFYERRQNKRRAITKQVRANIDGVSQTVTLVDITKSGSSFVMEKAYTLKIGTLVELFLESDKGRSGAVISESNGIMHLSFIY